MTQQQAKENKARTSCIMAGNSDKSTSKSPRKTGKNNNF